MTARTENLSEHILCAQRVARDLGGMVVGPAYSEDGGTGCWTWRGRLSRKGYGCVYDMDAQKQMPAHRWMWRQLVGEIPEGKQLDHLCRNRACVNPAHLEPVTNAENQQRGMRARLTPDQVRTMRLVYASGAATQECLARRFGVTGDTVYRVIRRKSWANV